MQLQLKTLLQLQVVYLILALAYNLVSGYFLTQTGKGLSATAPMSGLIVMLIYGSFLIPGRIGKLGLYRALMALAILILGYGGVVSHILTIRHSLDAYHSLGAALSAIAINVFGLIWNTIAALGWFKIPEFGGSKTALP
ncbi:MAG: hypothetical protein AAF598_20550 [Bacteroidota bacterium]